jgi:hypothetical protein
VHTVNWVADKVVKKEGCYRECFIRTTEDIVAIAVAKTDVEAKRRAAWMVDIHNAMGMYYGEK